MTPPRKIGPCGVKTTCAYCGVGCGLVTTQAPDGHIQVEADRSHPANFGRLCAKGAALPETLGNEGRLLYPEIGGQRASWDGALDHVADHFSQTIAEHGPDAVAFYVSGQLLTEDYYVANKLMKGFIGSANIDTNSRLCMASSVAGHKRAFGEDIVPGCYEDLELADLIVLAGSNAAWCHPVLHQRMIDREPGAPKPQIVVIDPRRTASCTDADLHLALAPGTDAVLFNGLLVHLARTGAVNTAYLNTATTGFTEALTEAQRTAPDIETVASACALDAAAVAQFYDLFSQTERTVTLYSQGINQSTSGTDKVNAIINCHLATGRIGKRGMGPFSLTGQPNAMGGREVGGLANQLAAHIDIDDGDGREAVRQFWNAPRIAEKPGLKAVELFEAMGRGEVKALWIMATNPAFSLPNAEQVRAALAACPLVVVSDCTRRTDTTGFADVLLPATAWAEKDGTVTNSERRISRQRGFLAPPGQAKPDWWIVSEVGKRMGHPAAFTYSGPADIFREHAGLTATTAGRKRLFDISALADIDDAVYEKLNPIQWPVGRSSGTARLLGGGIFPTDDGRARLIPITPRTPARAPNSRRPLVLNTGRTRDHWHSMTRTGLSPRLTAHAPEPVADIHPDDAAQTGIADGGLVRIESDQGAMVARAHVTEAQTRGGIFAPIHWNDQFARLAGVGQLIPSMCDPISGQPELKQTPVSAVPFDVAWHGFALTRNPAELDGAEWWARSRGENHHRVEFAGLAPPNDWDLWARAMLGELHGGGEWLAYRDGSRGRYRFAAIRGGILSGCLFVAPDPILPARGWLAGLFARAPLSADDRLGLLTGAPTGAQSDQGGVVCACNGITRGTIENAIEATPSASVAAISAATGAGAACGACRPELAELLSAHEDRRGPGSRPRGSPGPVLRRSARC